MHHNIKRPEYIDRIRPFIGKPIIKVLTGQRRVGKSFIMLQLTDEVKSMYPGANIVYINLELYEYHTIRTHSDLYQYVVSKLVPGKPNFLFIDEMQDIPSFETCLRSLLAENACDITVTGSNAKMLSGELATLLSGRIVQFQVHSLSYPEFLSFHSLKNSDHSLVDYLKYGGMPYLRNTGLDAGVVHEYLKNVNSTILLKDVVARENIRNVSFLENLVAFLADNTGSILSALNISRYLKSQQQHVPTQTVLNYLHALTNAFYVHKVQRADVKGLKIFEVGEKYYFEDLGLRNVLRSYEYKSDVHKLMENVVFMHLKRNNFTVYVGKSGHQEIDFMTERDGERKYFQVTYMLFDESTAKREFGKLEAIKDNYPKFVITLDAVPPVRSNKGIQTVHLRDFLSTSDL
ncbi:MAG: ATP-binding protein [Bacteroidales bacterium]